MSPSYFTGANAGSYEIRYGTIMNSYVYNTKGVVPVLNLKSDILYYDGDGTQDNPYVVKLN